jgi:F0F1-type ATP synthase assembly protein I
LGYTSKALTAELATMASRKPDDDRSFLQRTAESFQENVARSGPAAAASYGLVGAILFCGGVGYAIDAWRGTSPWFLVGGLLLGIVVGFYELVRTVLQSQRSDRKP